MCKQSRVISDVCAEKKVGRIQPAFVSSKSTIERLDKGVKVTFKVNIKDTEVVLVSLLTTLNK